MRAEQEERRLGGAGNVAMMVQALGAEAMLCGLVGLDRHLLGLGMAAIRNAWLQTGGITTTKTRLWIDGRMVGPRIDQDSAEPLYQFNVKTFIDAIRTFDPDAIIVADHGKGVVTAPLMLDLIDLGIPLYLDPVKQTPSAFDLKQTVEAIVAHDHERPKCYRAKCIIRKFGADGIKWGEQSLPSTCRDLVDPLGAGDQFIAALAYRRCLGDDWDDAIRWANVAAGLQCERAGCMPVTAEEITQHPSN